MTVPKSPPECPNDSRNAEETDGQKTRELDRLAGEIRALVGGPPPSDEERAQRDRERAAERDGGRCGACGRELADGEPVYRISVFNGRGMGGGYSRSVAPRCKDCVDAYEKRPLAPDSTELWLFMMAQVRKRVPWALLHLPLLPPAPCVVCGRPVVNERSARRPMVVADDGRGLVPGGHILCSERCTQAHWAAYRHERWMEEAAEARHKTCPVCGEVFDGTRRDQVTCSPACRQRAYRRRRRLTGQEPEEAERCAG